MGFLDYFRNRSGQTTQGDLFKSLEESEIVIDNSDPTQIAAYNRLHDLVRDRGGQPRTHRAINAIAIQQILSEDPGSLYEALGIPQGRRSRLPMAAKEALMVGNIAAFYEIAADQGIRGHRDVTLPALKGRGFLRSDTVSYTEVTLVQHS